MSYELTIVIPVYNEEANLTRVAKELSAYLLVATKKTKVLFVDDGSEDNSLGLMETICRDTDDFNFISFEKNCGFIAPL